MMRILFGLVLAVLLSVPGLLDVVLGSAAWGLSQTPVLAFAAGLFAWPWIARTVRGWAS